MNSALILTEPPPACNVLPPDVKRSCYAMVSDARAPGGATPSHINPNQSPYERVAYLYLERGYSVIPIAPGTKRPGQWSKDDGWRGMHDWERFHGRLPTEIELEHWYTWPDAGIGLLTGKFSRVVALDRDYDVRGTDALEAIIPWTPVKKKGAKGYTAFFRYNGERSCSFNIGGARVLDVLSDGRQTLMPGTLHPEGHTYVYLTEDTLEGYDPDDLPALPDNFLEQVAAVLLPYQTEEDQKYQRKYVAPKDDDSQINTGLSTDAEYFRDLNRCALANIDAWVERLVPGCRRERDCWRAVATWRGAKNHNVGVHPTGIFDFGGNYGMTPIDLVMYANQVPFAKAAEALRTLVPMPVVEHIEMTVGGRPMGAPAAAAMPWMAPPAVPAPTGQGGAPAAGAPAPLLPWQRPAAVTQEPVPMMLPPQTSIDPAPAVPSFILNPPGILGTIARWITETAPKSQPELAVAAAICLGSVVMARSYRTESGNFTGLYFIMVAKSAEGKEHPQACVEKVLVDAGLTNLVGGSGYTSPAAVFSALLKSPAHIVTIDEIGKYLKASRSHGNANAEGAVDKLVEAFGRQNGTLYPPTYSTMTLKKGEKSNLNAERLVHNPCITLLGATTPGTFYDNLTDDLVKDGFLGRCIVVESKQPRQIERMVSSAPPPPQIIDWCHAVHAGGVTGNLADVMVADLPAKVIELRFSDSCVKMLDAFAAELIDEKTAAETEGLDVLLGRTREKAMKLAMIACKAENPANREIQTHHLEWAIRYVRHYDTAMVRAVVEQRTENEHDAQIKKLVRYVANARKYVKDSEFKDMNLLQRGFMPKRKLLKLMRMKARTLDELLDTAVQAGYILKSPDLIADIYTVAPA